MLRATISKPNLAVPLKFNQQITSTLFLNLKIDAMYTYVPEKTIPHFTSNKVINGLHRLEKDATKSVVDKRRIVN